jgi:glycosylphosphatidylinositol transamidase (GPIT) subunit GPI8
MNRDCESAKLNIGIIVAVIVCIALVLLLGLLTGKAIIR